MHIRILGTRTVPPTLRGRGTPRPQAPRRAERVARREIPYWRERGWILQGNVYHGTYQTAHGGFRGMIEDRGWSDLRFYMFEPPDAVRQSSHWACFQARGKKGYYVHMGTRPNDVGSGILTIERLISESFTHHRR